jgi:hypothetical protein
MIDLVGWPNAFGLRNAIARERGIAAYRAWLPLERIKSKCDPHIPEQRPYSDLSREEFLKPLRSQRGVGSRVLNIAVPEIRVQRRPQPPLWSLYGVRVLRADYKRPWAELREGLSKLNLA